MHRAKLSNAILAFAIAATIAVPYAHAINEGLDFKEIPSGTAESGTIEKGDGETSSSAYGYTFNIGEKKPPKEIDWIKRAKRGSHGNVTCYIDKDGVPTAVFVIGIAPVSKTLIAVDARREALEEAEANAKEAFALWMKERVSVKNVRERKTIIVHTDGVEHSETERMSKQVFEQAATASWRGMSVFADCLKDGEYISIWRWSVMEQQLARMVEILTQDGDAEEVRGKAKRKVKWEVEEHGLEFREDD